MAAGATYEPIATTTLTSGTTYSFTSIPSTYTDLILVINGTAAAGGPAELRMQFNSDTATNYSYTRILGSGSVVSSSRGTSTTYIIAGQVSTTDPAVTLCNIQNYANTTTNKTIISNYGNYNPTNNNTGAVVGLWRSTAAINRIDLTVNVAFAATSYLTLYGIAAA
ncbi:hypothetical protein UFOVP974_15 [uncultured Caudovirales phage]|uniref:Uncharacterized protein n=1 Tax=uncultured Caudovirales phage TaxID=2100421 RepID=A0A6J5T3I3_9CAUD|nr:hypothetical protein UFOVP974_15 [uncultured Caudovirales phage]CAB4194024.1 hypothetical protein UFOVP1256_3 [uncultured Caudovirales phage]CAB4222169.1 hypothetical protein UFOVP1643_25 [uncultured Caudovirales phage]